jgi:hypothetical protein
VSNLVFVSAPARSGVKILSAHPKLYWNDHCHGREWRRFTRRRMPTDRLWTCKDEEEPCPAWLALPGGSRLGLGDGCIYGTLSLGLACHPQTILADHRNGWLLPVEHDAPLRPRVENQLGFKMVRHPRALELVVDYRTIGQGLGGWREDHQDYRPTPGT